MLATSYNQHRHALSILSLTVVGIAPCLSYCNPPPSHLALLAKAAMREGARGGEDGASEGARRWLVKAMCW